jgi:hypothetical protein
MHAFCLSVSIQSHLSSFPRIELYSTLSLCTQIVSTVLFSWSSLSAFSRTNRPSKQRAHSKNQIRTVTAKTTLSPTPRLHQVCRLFQISQPGSVIVMGIVTVGKQQLALYAFGHLYGTLPGLMVTVTIGGVFGSLTYKIMSIMKSRHRPITNPTLSTYYASKRIEFSNIFVTRSIYITSAYHRQN